MNEQLALLKRAVLVDGRSIANYLSWLGGGILVFFFLLQIGGSRTFTGLTFLKIITGINLFVITVTGVVGFSSSITEEKEEETLGLLLMSGITTGSLIFSKAMARVIRGIFLTLTQLPFVIISIALGGITLNQVLAIYITFISYIIFLAFFCSLFSVICPKTNIAAVCSGFSLFLLFIFVSEAGTPLNYFNPFEIMEIVLKNGYNDYFVVQQVSSQLIAAGLCYFVSIKIFQPTKDSSHTPSLKTKVKSYTKKIKMRNSRSWSDAVCWKDFNFFYGGKGWWLWQSIIILSIGLVFLSQNHRVTPERIMQSMFLSAALCLCLQLVFIAQSLMSKEFKQQTHTALFTLPGELNSLILSKLYAGIIAVMPSLIITLLAILYILDSEGLDGFWGLSIAISYVLVYLTMTFYLSLRIHLFAFVLSGFGTIFLGTLSVMISASSGSFESVAVFIGIINVGASLFFISMAFNDIRAKASQN